jgi:hypothetical protein
LAIKHIALHIDREEGARREVRLGETVHVVLLTKGQGETSENVRSIVRSLNPTSEGRAFPRALTDRHRLAALLGTSILAGPEASVP